MLWTTIPGKRTGQGPEVHVHMSALAVGGGGKVGVVGSSSILDGDGNTVVTLSSIGAVVVLEVEGRLGKAGEYT